MKVLLIEPVTELRVMLRGVLKALDIEDLYEPRTSLEGMKILLEGNIDLILFSKDIEPFNGYLTMKMIRNCKEEKIRHVRAIMTSGITDEDILNKAYDVGVDIFLPKPFSSDDVRSAIMQIINDRNAFLETPVYSGPCRRNTDALKIGEYDRRDITYNPGRAKFDRSLRKIVQRILDNRNKENKNKLSSREEELKARGGIIIDRDFEEESKSVNDLKAGMVTSKGVKSKADMLIIPSMTTITETAIARLKDMVITNKLADGIWVQKGVIKDDAKEVEDAL